MNKTQAQVQAAKVVETLSTDGHTIKKVNEVYRQRQDSDPVYYEVLADVTSITGDTREYVVIVDSNGGVVESDYRDDSPGFKTSNFSGTCLR